MADSERARAGGGKETPVPAGLIARLTNSVRGMAAGFNGTWFPPGDPVRNVAPNPEAIRGRRFDYPAYVNTTYTPRSGESPVSVDFATLRRLAEPTNGGLDLLRLAIETRKDQMITQKWNIRGRAKADDGGDAARMLEAQLRKPDGANTYRQWLKLLLEDHFVIDAASVYYRQTSAGMLLEVIDGATLKVLLDDRGRTPVPPLPAYQQIIHGAPATDYTTKELGYYAYNPRPSRAYGMSRVEQVVGIVTLALNRQLSVLEYYTSGSVPDMFIGVPDTWQVDQIKDFQTWWDSVLAGQTGEKRKARFIPGGMEPYPTKSEVLKDEFDEWLARVVCYAFSLSPQTLVREQNRATAQTAKLASAEEGLEPVKLFVKDAMDDALLRMGFPNLEWGWVDEEIQDPTTKATVIQAYTGNRPIVGLDEARTIAGLEAASPEVRAELDPLWLAPPTPVVGGGGDSTSGDNADGGDNGDGGGDGQNGNGKDPAAKSRRGRLLRPRENPRLTAATEGAVGRLVQAILAEQRTALLDSLESRTTKAQTAPAGGGPATEDDLRELLRTLENRTWNDRARLRLRELLKRLGKDRALAAVRAIKGADDGTAAFQHLVNQANENAIAWSESQVGNLITRVSATTRNAVNELTAAAIRDGATNAELATRLEDAYAFSPARSALIARTETAFAETGGTLAGYKAAGVLEKEWSADELACDECAALDGERVAIDAPFSTGDQGSPAHPGCRCVIVAVVPD